MKWRLLIAALCARMELVEPHGAMTFPPPRNAVDSDEAPWSGGVPIPVPFQPWCPFPSSTEAGNAQNLSASNGQACFWFSNGCAIGCDSCDGSTRGPIPHFDASGELVLNYSDPILCAKLGKPKDCVPGIFHRAVGLRSNVQISRCEATRVQKPRQGHKLCRPIDQHGCGVRLGNCGSTVSFSTA